MVCWCLKGIVAVLRYYRCLMGIVGVLMVLLVS